jgi:LuxR family maltose regulon positive regulatory protein
MSERELEILRLMAEGLSNREIADKLVITVGTTKSHVHHILEKVGSDSRMQAVAKAREMGLL